MKGLFSTITLGIWLSSIAGAQTYFNNKATLNNCCVSLSAVTQAHGKYFTAGYGVDSINSLGGGAFIGIGGVKFSVWDRQGRLIHDTAYQRPDSGQTFVVNKAMFELPNHTFLIPAEGGDTKGHVKLLLYCFDTTAHLLWKKEWDKPAEFPMIIPFDGWRMADFKPDGYGNYLMLSSIDRSPTNTTSDYSTRILITKLDSGFNEIWHKSFGDNQYSSVARSLLVENGSYTFGGYYSNIAMNSRQTFFRTELFRTDTAGNLLWHWQSDTATIRMGFNHLIRTKDGNLTFCGQGAGVPRYFNGFVDIYWRPWIEKIDTNGKTIWSHAVWSFPTNRESSAFSKLVELDNGDLMACGMITRGFDSTDSADATYGMLVRYASDGTLMWRRKYDYLGDTMYYMLYDMKRTQDGGYIMAGQSMEAIHQVSSTLPWQRAWLLKVDSNGCASNDDPQCWTVGVPAEPKLTAGSYRVYPNPAAEQLQISYSMASPANEVFSLFDITGRKVVEATLKGQAKTITLDISRFNAGMYFYRVIDTDGVLKASGKLIKQ